MSPIAFWALSLGYLGAAIAASFAGPRGLRLPARGVAVTLVLSTLAGAIPYDLRPSAAVLDVGSSFLLACWILFVAFRHPTAWSGGLLVLQGVELALGAACLGPEAELLREPFDKVLNVINIVIVAYLLLAVVVKQAAVRRAASSPSPQARAGMREHYGAS